MTKTPTRKSDSARFLSTPGCLHSIIVDYKTREKKLCGTSVSEHSPNGCLCYGHDLLVFKKVAFTPSKADVRERFNYEYAGEGLPLDLATIVESEKQAILEKGGVRLGARSYLAPLMTTRP